MANSANPDHLVSSEANWSGSILFAKEGYIKIQQDKGKGLKVSQALTWIIYFFEQPTCEAYKFVYEYKLLKDCKADKKTHTQKKKKQQQKQKFVNML